MHNPVLGTNEIKPAPRAGFYNFSTFGDTPGTRRKQKRFLYMQFRPAQIYPSNLDTAVPKWFVYYSYMNPVTGAWERFKVYEDINRQPAADKAQYAKDLRDMVNQALKNGYDPYDEERKVRTLQEERKQRAQAEAAGDKRNISLLRGLNLFMEAKKEAGKSKSTLDSYNTICNIAKNWLNDNKLLLVPARTISGTQYMEMLKEAAVARKWENKTYNNYLLFLETTLNWMADDINGSIIPFNPIKGAEQREVLDRKPSAYTDEELNTILSAVRKNRDAYMEGIILTCYYAAVRSKSEMRGLKVGNIQFDMDLLLLSADATKARREDYIPLDPYLKGYYLQQGLDKLPKDWYVFSANGGPGPKKASANHYARKYRPYREMVGISEDKTLYNWKHTRAVHLGKAKVDIYAIKQLFRHRSVEETENYMRDLGLIIDRGAVQASRKL